MDGYTSIAIAVVFITSLLLLIILRKNKVLNATVIIGIAVSSAVISLLFPAIFSAMSAVPLFTDTVSSLIAAGTASFFIYILLIVLCTMLVSSLASNNKHFIRLGKGIHELHMKMRLKVQSIRQHRTPESELQLAAESVADKCINGITETELPATEAGLQVRQEQLDEPVEKTSHEVADTHQLLEGHSSLEELSIGNGLNTTDLEMTGETYEYDPELQTDDELKALDELISQDESQSWKESVALETAPEVNAEYLKDAQDEIEIDKEDGISLDKLIDQAFSLKRAGKYEEAITSYMSALELQPGNDVVFLIILEICTLYKELGKRDLAMLILESYAEEYSDVMDETIRYEIEKNLLSI